MSRCVRLAVLVLVSSGAAARAADVMPLWKDGEAKCRLILPAGDAHAVRLVRSTFSYHLRRSFGFEMPVAPDIGQPGNYIVVGSPAGHPVIAKLVADGMKLTPGDLGDEGFRILTHQAGPSRCIVICGRTAQAFKHGCQELLFYRLAATAGGVEVDWPLDVMMRPAFAYRGVYMLPCWSARDSFASWVRVLRFHSELTINRNWFWLDGFPVAGHTGEYAGTDLAEAKNVQALIDLCNDEGMKLLIGGGWFNWHHEKAVGKDYARGRDYYLAYLKAFRGFHGFYIEPTGEGSEIKNWRPECDMLRELIRAVLKERPDHEFAVAIGKFNNAEYLKLMAQLDPRRVFWWWCWGDPIRDKALDLYPSVLRWHIINRMHEYHGSMAAPEPRERPLAGVTTSYDPGQGYGNPWDGWGKLGYDKPRDFDPYKVPFFGHQYFYRERCWDLDLSEEVFVARLHRRLFDADAPAEAGERYWRLTQMTLQCNLGTKPTPASLKPIREFLDALRGRPCTPRMADALARMEEAVGQLHRIAEAGGAK